MVYHYHPPTNLREGNIFIVRNEVAKVIFSQACVCPQEGCLVRGCVCSWGGGSGLGGWGVCGVSCPRGVWSWGAWSQGCVCLVWGCVCSWGCLVWGLVSQHALRETPQERLLLLRTVHILLECILVSRVSVILPGGGSYYLWCTGGNPLKPSPPHGSHFSGLTKFLTLP